MWARGEEVAFVLVSSAHFHACAQKYELLALVRSARTGDHTK